MNCNRCKQSVNENSFCLCTTCGKPHCIKCAQRDEFVCSCGGDIEYLP